MRTHVQKLSEFEYRGRTLETLYVIRDKRGVPALLPLMYAIHLSSFGVVYGYRYAIDEHSGKRIKQRYENPISDTTIRAYTHNLASFLQSYLEANNDSPFGIHNSAECSEELINQYLNEILPDLLNSLTSLEVHRSSLLAYFNWLDFMEIRPAPDLQIYRKTRHKMAVKSEATHYIQYVTRRSRSNLVSACVNLGEKLIMRMGFEVGLRTSEVSALQFAGKGKLEELFEQIDSPEHSHRQIFSYRLEGKYTKGGRSRSIWIDRTLLVDMKRYALGERERLLKITKRSCSSFFLRTDERGRGTAISKGHATRAFRKRAAEAKLNPLYTFHDLRHTYATELYHSELKGRGGRDTRSESAALLVVADRLGHKSTKSGQAPPTTVRYIRMRLEMLQLEELE